MNRNTLNSDKLTPETAATIASYHSDVVNEVAGAVEANKVVVVGMTGNPFVKKARKALDDAKVEYKYLGYGSYMSMWKQRLAIKLWSGWATYPQVFVNGKLVGGANDLIKFISAGNLK